MSKTAQITMRVDPNIREQAGNVLSQLGMNMSEAITIFLRQVVIHDGLPFAVKKSPQYNRETLEAMRECEEIAESGNWRFKNPDEMFKALGI